MQAMNKGPNPFRLSTPDNIAGINLQWALSNRLHNRSDLVKLFQKSMYGRKEILPTKFRVVLRYTQIAANKLKAAAIMPKLNFILQRLLK